MGVQKFILKYGAIIGLISAIIITYVAYHPEKFYLGKFILPWFIIVTSVSVIHYFNWNKQNVKLTETLIVALRVNIVASLLIIIIVMALYKFSNDVKVIQMEVYKQDLIQQKLDTKKITESLKVWDANFVQYKTSAFLQYCLFNGVVSTIIGLISLKIFTLIKK